MKTYDYPHGVLHISKFGMATITKGKNAANEVEAFLQPNDERIASVELTDSPNVDIVIKTRSKKSIRFNCKEFSEAKNSTEMWVKIVHLSNNDEIVSAGLHGPVWTARKAS